MINVAIVRAAIKGMAAIAAVFGQIGVALAQDAEASSSPEGMTMLILFLGIAGIIGVFVIRWSQSTGDDEDA